MKARCAARIVAIVVSIATERVALLALEHVAKYHWVGPYEKRTLDDVSLSLGAGDVVGIWGSHRSGKSTLLRIIAGLDAADRGSVRVIGHDVSRLSRSELGSLRLRQIGLVGAHGPHSARMSIADFVALPLLRIHAHGQARRQALAMLGRIDILECRDATWNQLSDSERALASLAHGLVRRPRLLLVDDLTQGLDALQQAEVMRLLRDAADDDDVAILMTASSMNALIGSHDAYRLSDGRLVHIASSAADVIDFPASRRTS